MSGLVVSGARCELSARRIAFEIGGAAVPLSAVGDVLEAGVNRLIFVGRDAELALLSGLLESFTMESTAVAYLGGDSSVARLFAHGEAIAGVIERWQGGTEYPMDVGEVTIAGETHRFVGWIAAGGAVRRGALFPWAASAASITVESERSWTIETARAVVAANTQEVGGWRLAPRAAVMDGRLDIQALSGSVATVARLRPTLRRGLHASTEAVWRRSLARAAIQVPSRWTVLADGVRVGRGSFTVSIAGKPLVLLV